MATAMARYGFMSAAAMRYSTRCDFSEPGMTRSAQVRFSTPQVALVGAQKPGMSREYELTVLATIESSSGISICWPPMKLPRAVSARLTLTHM